MNNIDIVILICGLTMFAALTFGIIHRVKTNTGIGFRFIQFLIIGMGIPSFMILAMTDKIDAKMIGGIIMGVLAGFGIAKTGGKDDENEK